MGVPRPAMKTYEEIPETDREMLSGRAAREGHSVLRTGKEVSLR
jgi:hypothetical protein